MRAVIIGAANTGDLPPVALIGPVVLVNFVQHELSRVSIDVTPVASVGVSAAAAASVGVDVVRQSPPSESATSQRRTAGCR